MTPDYSQIHNPTSYSGTDTINVGNDQSLPISNTGSVYVYTPTGTFSLSTLHHVPSLTSNLLSVYLFTKENNCTLLFNAYNFQIVDNLTKQIRYKGRCEHGLYTLLSELSASISSSSVANQAIRFSTWHRRLGHPCAEVTKSILSVLGFSFSTKDHCESCYVAKSSRLLFILSNTKATTPFELINSDVWVQPPFPLLMVFVTISVLLMIIVNLHGFIP